MLQLMAAGPGAPPAMLWQHLLGGEPAQLAEVNGFFRAFGSVVDKLKSFGQLGA